MSRYLTLRFELYHESDGHSQEEDYRAQLSIQDPRNQAGTSALRRPVNFDLKLLREQVLPRDYGAALSRQLFADRELREAFERVERDAQVSGCFLRVVIECSAPELDTLRWELLRHPARDEPLATSERVLLSRCIVSHDPTPVHLRPRGQLKAALVVAAPSAAELERLGLAAVDVDGELSRVRAALGEVEIVAELGTLEAPCTMKGLEKVLLGGVDVLYFVGHGKYSRSGVPALVFPGSDQGRVKYVNRDAFTKAFKGLEHPPRLVILASCGSAGDGNSVALAKRPSVQATLARDLADAGVVAVVAMQGDISMATVAEMMPELFARLAEDGQIDRALAVARRVVRDRGDVWQPALFSRLPDGLLWHVGARAKDIIGLHGRGGKRHEYFFGREELLAEIDEHVRSHDRSWVGGDWWPGVRQERAAGRVAVTTGESGAADRVSLHPARQPQLGSASGDSG